MNTNNVRLFDANNKIVQNFDEEIERILISVHGEDYYDTDEELVDTNAIKIINNHIEKKEVKEEIIDTKKKRKISIKDFVPVLFFILIFTVIIIAGYYFLNNIDLTSLM